MVNVTLVRVLARAQATRGRLGFAGAGVALVVLIAGLANFGPPSAGAVGSIIGNAAVSFLIPILTLLFAVACLGDLAEDRTLVYVWLRPVSRLTLALSAVASTVVAAGVPVAGGLALATMVGGRFDLVPPAIIAGLLGVAAYGAIFVALGIRSTRSLLWGIGYTLLWEGLASNVTLAFARLSLRRYVGSVFADLGDVAAVPHATSATHGALVLLGVAAGGTALTAWLLSRRDID